MSDLMARAGVVPAPRCPHYIPAVRAAQGMLMCRRCVFRGVRPAGSYGKSQESTVSPLPRSTRVDLADLKGAA